MTVSTIEDYRCKDCGNLVLYRIDHKPTCHHYPQWDTNPN